jgi:queuine tRNA-ribosyltransferase
MLSFSIEKRDENLKHARVGRLLTAHGEVETPAFLPIGTRGTVRAVTTEEVKFWGAQIILANTYHLWQRPGDTLIRRAGGLHKFIGWNGPILTDSGGYQVFSLGRRHFAGPKPEEAANYPRVLSVTDAGVKFRSEIDGSEHFLSPELSVRIQSNLGSDIALVLDEFYSYDATKEETAEALKRTFEWAKRAQAEFLRLKETGINPGQALFGIVQGGDYDDLRKISAEQIRSLNFPGYAVGGVAVSEEENEKMYAAVERTIPFLEENKPRHLLGVGTPEQIVQSVARGIDTFDCVLPTRNARHGELLVASKAQEGEGYRTLRITNAEFKEDFTPLDDTCSCYGCVNFTRAYLRHLFMAKEPLALRLATMHNLRFYLNLMSEIRRRIQYNSFGEMVKNYRRR